MTETEALALQISTLIHSVNQMCLRLHDINNRITGIYEVIGWVRDDVNNRNFEEIKAKQR